MTMLRDTFKRSRLLPPMELEFDYQGGLDKYDEFTELTRSSHRWIYQTTRLVLNICPHHFKRVAARAHLVNAKSNELEERTGKL